MHSIRTKFTLAVVSVIIITLSIATFIGVISIEKLGSDDADQMIHETRKGDHIGVKNVRDRVIDMTGGTFSVESTVGEGTSITIRIPE